MRVSSKPARLSAPGFRLFPARRPGDLGVCVAPTDSRAGGASQGLQCSETQARQDVASIRLIQVQGHGQVSGECGAPWPCSVARKRCTPSPDPPPLHLLYPLIPTASQGKRNQLGAQPDPCLSPPPPTPRARPGPSEHQADPGEGFPTLTMEHQQGQSPF